MAEREAKVRLNLASAGFLSSLRDLKKAATEFEKAVDDIGDGAKRASAKTSAFGSAWKSGLGTAKNSLAELGGTLKSTITQAATLGGALSLGSAALTAIDLESKYRDIATAIEAGTGKAQNFRDIQGMVEASAGRWSRANDEVADSFKAVYDDVGDLEFAKTAMEEIAKAARATGAPVEALRGIAGQLNEKFGVTAAELPDAMAAMIAMGNKGGISIQDLGEKLGIVGASAKMLGLEGKEGLSTVVAMMNTADGATGNLKKSVAAVSGVFDTLADPAKVKEIERAFTRYGEDGEVVKKLSLRTKGGELQKDAIERILGATGGKKEVLAKVFSGDQLKLMSTFGETYAKAFDEARGSTKEKTAAALAAYHDALQSAGKQTFSAADMEKKAQERLEDPRAKLKEAINEFGKSMQDPRVTQAIRDLAQELPKLAKALGGFVSWAAGNPLAGVGAIVGAKVATDVANAQIGKALSKALESEGKKLSLGGIVQITGAFMVGMGFGETIANAVFDALVAKENKQLGKNVQDVVGAQTATPEEIKAKIAEKENEARALEQGPDTLSLAALSEAYEGATLGMSWLAGKAGIIDAPEISTTRSRAQKDTYSTIDELRALLAEKEKAAGRVSSEGPDPARQMSSTLEKPADKLSSAADKMSRAAERIERAGGGGGGGTNGLPPSPGNAPGSAPR